MRYSGSPLAYSFSEAGQAKGSWLVTLGPRGVESVEPVDAPVPRPVAILRGTLDGLLRDPQLARHEPAWCQVTLTDAERPAEAMHRLRSRFPHTLELRFQPEGVSVRTERSYLERVTGADDVEICCGFVEHVRGRPPGPAELSWLRDAVAAGRLTDAEEDGVAAQRARLRETPATAGDEPAPRVLVLSDEPTLLEVASPADGPSRRRVAAQRRRGELRGLATADVQLALEDVG